MNPSWAQRLLLGAFPARFRRRYGQELTAMVPECGGGLKVTADLAKSVASQWLSPSYPGSLEERRRLRLQSTTSTVMVVWAFSALAAAIFGRSVDDKPVPGLHSWGWTAYAAGVVAFEVTAGAVLVVGFAYWLRVVIPAWRARDRSTLVPAVLPIAVGTLWLAATAVVAFVGHHITLHDYRHFNAQAPLTPGGWTVLVLYGLFTVACVGLCAASVVRALSKSNLPTRLLTWSTLMSSAVSGILLLVAVAAGVCATRALAVGGIDPRNTLMLLGSLVVLLALSALAMVSSVRGLRMVLAPA